MKRLPDKYDYKSKIISSEHQRLFDKLIAHQSFDDEDIIALSKYRTVHYLPWLEWLDDVEKLKVGDVIDELLKNVELSEEERFDLNYIVNDFYDSEYDSFIEYYCQKETKSLKFEMPLDFKSGTMRDLAMRESMKNLSVMNRIDNLLTLPHNFYVGNSNATPKSQVNEVFNNFSTLFHVMAGLYCKLDANYAKENQFGEDDLNPHYKNLVYETMRDYFEAIWMELMSDNLPIVLTNMVYVGSTRANAKRFYSFDKLSFEQNSELNINLKTYLELKNEFELLLPEYKIRAINHQRDLEKKNETEIAEVSSNIDMVNTKVNNFLNAWLQKFEICDSVSIDPFVPPHQNVIYGCSIALEKNGKYHSIVDEGFGCIQIFSVLLSVQIAIYKQLIEHMRDGRIEKWVVTIEEPENHLHPRLQSLLADMFLDVFEQFGVKFIIETHSEYMIRKSQVLVAKMNFNSNVESDENSPFRTWYIPDNDKPYSLGYRKDGKFAESFGKGFYDESARLAFEIL